MNDDLDATDYVRRLKCSINSDLTRWEAALVSARQMVGNWGNEGPDLGADLQPQDEYARGWMDAITHAQSQIDTLLALAPEPAHVTAARVLLAEQDRLRGKPLEEMTNMEAEIMLLPNLRAIVEARHD